MTIRLIIDGNSVYEIDEDWERMNKGGKKNREETEKEQEEKTQLHEEIN